MLASTNVTVVWICYNMARYRYLNLNLKAINENSYCSCREILQKDKNIYMYKTACCIIGLTSL